MIVSVRLRLFTVLALAVSSASGAEPAAAPPAVRTVAPASAAKAASYSVPGRTEPFESARIFTRAVGIVKERRFDIGDLVKAGDVLAVIDVPDLERAVESARATVEQAQARADNSRSLASRSTNLFKSNAISREELDDRSSAAEVSAAALRVAMADLHRIEEQKNFSTVRAPFDAVVAGRNFDRGDRVRGDSATAEGWLYLLVRLDTLRFAISATPDLALRLGAESTAKVRFGEYPGRTFTAQVARTSRIFDPAAGTMRIELAIENKDLALPAGLTGTATFDLRPASGTFLVPTNTLVTRAGQTLLASVEAGKVVYIDVLPGRNFGASVEVSSAALAATTAVIVNPNALLRAGDEVTVANVAAK